MPEAATLRQRLAVTLRYLDVLNTVADAKFSFCILSLLGTQAVAERTLRSAVRPQIIQCFRDC
jgi:hypothetical protein